MKTKKIIYFKPPADFIIKDIMDYIKAAYHTSKYGFEQDFPDDKPVKYKITITIVKE